MSLNSSGSGAVVHGEDVYRKADNSDCLMFNEFFAAAAILVSIVYYAVVKLSLMAMGAVVMLPPVPHPSYQGSEDDEDGEITNSSGEEDYGDDADDAIARSSSSATSCTSSDPGEDDAECSNGKGFGHSMAVRKEGATYDSATESPNVFCIEDVVDGSAQEAERLTVQAFEHEGGTGEEEKKGSRPKHSRDEQGESACADSSGGIGPCIIHVSSPSPPSRPHSPSSLSSLSSSMSEWVAYDEKDGACKLHRKGKGGLNHDGTLSAAKGPSQRHRKKKKASPRGEKFNAIKIWTNIYGLSLGIYCLVYSLLQPNELSAFVFCVAMLLCGVCEAAVPCMQHYIFDEYEYREVGEHQSCQPNAGPARIARVRIRLGAMTACKRIVGWLCLCQNLIGREVSESAKSSVRSIVKGSVKGAVQLRTRLSHRRQRSRSRREGCLWWINWIHPCCSARKQRRCGNRRGQSCSFICSGVLGMPFLILLIAGGLVCKLAACLLASSSPSAGGATVWGLFMHAVASAGYPASESDNTSVSAAYVAVSVLFPIVGVLMLKSMKRARNVRQTMELSVPVCGLNSLCIMCLVMMQGRGCIMDHLYSTTVAHASSETNSVPSYQGGLSSPSSVPALPWLNGSFGVDHENASSSNIVSGFISSSSSAAGSYMHASIPSASSLASHMQAGYSGDPGGPQTVTVMEPYPMLAAMVLPFPLVCSVVCIVSAWRNHRVMVRELIECMP